jgi:hypothetical protein
MHFSQVPNKFLNECGHYYWESIQEIKKRWVSHKASGIWERQRDRNIASSTKTQGKSRWQESSCGVWVENPIHNQDGNDARLAATNLWETRTFIGYARQPPHPPQLRARHVLYVCLLTPFQSSTQRQNAAPGWNPAQTLKCERGPNTNPIRLHGPDAGNARSGKFSRYASGLPHTRAPESGPMPNLYVKTLSQMIPRAV